MADPSDLSTGKKVRWGYGDSNAYGRIAKVKKSGSASSDAGGEEGETLDASDDNPAYVIDVYRYEDGSWSKSDDTVVHRAGSLSVISDFPESS